MDYWCGIWGLLNPHCASYNEYNHYSCLKLCVSDWLIAQQVNGTGDCGRVLGGFESSRLSVSSLQGEGDLGREFS